jgi:OmcA/MtrC family decaheme c-type cytochrome
MSHRQANLATIVLSAAALVAAVAVAACQGAPGQQGPIGDTGETGPSGALGPTGGQGPAGATGASGAIGATGTGGATGATGSVGPTGVSAPGAPLGSGLLLAVTSATISSSGQIAVTILATDQNGATLEPSDLDRLRVTVAALRPSADDAQHDEWRSFVLCAAPAPNASLRRPCNEYVVKAGALQGNASAAPGGALAYTLTATAPADDDRTRLHRVAIEGRRSQGDPNQTGVARYWFAESHLDLVPAGGAVPTRNIVTAAACGGCHGPSGVGAHGGNRSDPANCVTCHTVQNVDLSVAGQVLELDWMLHKLHRGKDLPSVLGGAANIINGNDFSTVGFPQDIATCTACHDTNAADAGRRFSEASKLACTGCHDRTWFGQLADLPAGWTPHRGGRQDDSTACRSCHPASGGLAGVADNHWTPYTLSPAPPTFALAITSVSASPGAPAVIAFSMADRSGAPLTSSASVGRLAATMAGPTSEYAASTQATAIGRGPTGILENLGGGAWRYTFAAATPTTAAGTWAFGLEGYRNGTLPDGTVYRYGAKNPIVYLAMQAGATPVPRRQVVDAAKCNACHGELAAHGNNRVGEPQYCVMCHDPSQTDAAFRPPNAGPPLHVDFKVMIHKLHTGANLASVAGGTPYVIWGFGNSPNDFSGVRFPGQLADCSTCHSGTTYNTAPSTAVCTSCHDDPPALAHAAIMTSAGVESCTVCHSNDDAFSAALVHRR